ncbi:hypothetical protein FE257_000770 [Aspergillus nanangensis]|uniref:Rhodopsin domain-containing protein n=1 Tax=Aspergillus nanangensis TaxID=2582783 RepID=A0AAD4CEL6_ASPNN|nr:hypothetical protein FE257_000770 [Aspergillus nanangensis]
MASLTDEQIQLQLKSLWLSIPFYNMSLTLTKAAIVFLYLRLFPTAKFIVAARVILAVIILYGLWTVISAFLNCLPVNYFWDTSVDGHCIPKAFLWWFNAAMNILTDISILVLPIPVVSRLRLPFRQKIAVLFIFATGIFACVTSIVRLRYLTLATHSVDPTKDNGPIAIWSQIEVNMGIICACLPPLQSLVTRLFPRILASKSRSQRHYINRSSHENPRPTGGTAGPSTAAYPVEDNTSSHGIDSILITRDLHIEFSDNEFTVADETESDRGLVLQEMNKI